MALKKDLPLLRPARTSDIETIVGFNAALARETENLHLDPMVLRDGVTRILHDASLGRYFLLECNDQVVAQIMITYEWSDWRNGMIWWIQSVYVDTAHRRQGLYRMLHSHVRTESIKSGSVGLRLYAHRENETAAKTYESCGMVCTSYRVFAEEFGGHSPH